jgi:hypothetical protein
MILCWERSCIRCHHNEFWQKASADAIQVELSWRSAALNEQAVDTDGKVKELGVRSDASSAVVSE